MKALVSLCLIGLTFSISTCSKAIEESNTTSDDSPALQTAENESLAPFSNQVSEVVESTPPTNPRNRVVQNGKVYIKKSGWTKPSSKESYVTQRETEIGTTEDGKEIEVRSIFYDHNTPRLFSENFYFEGSGLNNMKGILRSGGFTEYSVRGKRFMYAVFVERVVSPPASNSDPPNEPFVYLIRDSDGDGIFETLGGWDLIVPDWVVK